MAIVTPLQEARDEVVRARSAITRAWRLVREQDTDNPETLRDIIAAVDELEALKAVIAQSHMRLSLLIEKPELKAAALVEAFTSMDQAYSFHTQVCSDQRCERGCDDCTALTAARWDAEKAMKANPDAVALYDSPEKRAERRCWTREVFNPLHESVSREDY